MPQQPFWPGGARLAVSLSLMFEGGGQPISGSGGPIPEPIKDGLPDLPTNAFFAYGPNEGIPRILEPDGQASDQAVVVHDRPSDPEGARTRKGDRPAGDTKPVRTAALGRTATR